ncbi:hypothetical protein ACVIHI_008326 [Bradyrhizobium sp. USDA 4524]|nr:hypothetical protein [Bradyrhizobium sp. USDA 4538]MCP1899314.1 hypothetical protein [Bradyrhizobium sp. USDA 4537]MCP1986574.1 hypothetical protein [Bradyrhizobium sp. USDA 4539]
MCNWRKGAFEPTVPCALICAASRQWQIGEETTPISTLMFRAAFQFTINAIFDPIDRKRL